MFAKGYLKTRLIRFLNSFTEEILSVRFTEQVTLIVNKNSNRLEDFDAASAVIHMDTFLECSFMKALIFSWLFKVVLNYYTKEFPEFLELPTRQ